MASESDYTMKSERIIRNGFMGLVVKISNKLQSKCPKVDEASESQASAPTAASTTPGGTEDSVVIEYLDQVGEEWKSFVDGELASSNEKNNRTLGGSTRTTNDYDDERDDNSYEV